MAQTTRTFRVFVSSTFSDLKVERNALQEEVFPKLRELCLQHGCRFQAIDLRWGVSEEAAIDQQTMKICLTELKRCQEVSPRPNFIVLLGDRYGWRPLPEEIPAEEFTDILARGSHEERKLFLWEDRQPEERKGWYRYDDNAVPPVYVLQPRTGRFIDSDTWQHEVEDPLRALLFKATQDLPLSPEVRLKYTASATEQEIEHGALLVQDACEHVFCFFRTIKGLPVEKAATDPEVSRLTQDFIDLNRQGQVEHEAQDHLERLKGKLAARLPKNYYTYEARWQGDPDAPFSTDHLKPLCDDAYRVLSNVILTQIRLLEETSPQEQEIAAHESFGRERAAWFLGRREQLTSVMVYLEGDAPFPLAVLGKMGSGKSALLAQALEICRRRWPQATIISRFLGSTPSSAQGRILLEGLCRQLGAEAALPTEFHDLVRDFYQRLEQAGPNGPIILFLDALDQFPAGDPARFLAWLPSRLPPQVRLVVSAQSPGDAADTLTRRLHAAHLVHLPPLPADEACELLALWLEADARTVTAAQWRAVMDGYAHHGLPLYLKLAFEEARRWQSFTPAADLPGDVSGLIRHLFGRLSQDDHHGRLLVSRSLGYLATARHGLSEDELLELLSRDEDVLGDFFRRSYHDPPQPNLPVVVWSRLFSELEPYLMLRRADDAELLAFYHPRLSEETAALFLSEAERHQRHRCLAAFFHDQPLRWREGDRVLPNRRRLSELPYHQTLGGLKSELLKTMTDLRFVETKAAAGLPYDLLADLDRALLRWNWLPLHQLRQALAQTVPWMAERPEMALQFLFNRLSWTTPLDPALSTILPRWGAHLEGRGHWLRAAAPLPGAGARSEVRLSLETPTGIQSLVSGGEALAAATAKGILEVRNTHQGGLLDRRQLPASGIEAVALREDRTVAYLTRAGVMGVETSDAVLAGRPGEDILAAHPRHGILGVAQNHSLVAWNPEENTIVILADNLPQPLVALRLTPYGEAALFVAGRRPQVVGLSRWDGRLWRTSVFTYEGPTVVDADLDSQGKQALLLCYDRSVKLVAAHDPNTPLAVLHYETRPGGLQGQPRKVRFGRGESAGWAFFATGAGHLACWHWQEDLVVRLENLRRSVTDPSFLVVFEVVPETGRLFYSTANFGREISRTGDHRSTAGHLATVAACQFTDSGKVVSLSELDQTVRWTSSEGLTPLACQTVREPSALAPRPGSDEVFLGTSQSLLWVQSPHHPPTGHDQIQVQADRLVSLVPLSPYQVLAAGKAGRIVKLDFKKERSERVWSGTGFRQQKMILPAGRTGLCWSVYREETAGQPLVISLVTGLNRERVVLKTEESFIFLDAAVSPDGVSLALAGEVVEVFRLVREGFWRRPNWIPQHRRQTTVKWAAFLGQGELLAVILADSPWLEVWGVEEGLPTVAAAELPSEASCLAAKGHRLVVGFTTGDLMSLTLTGNLSP